jgi:hypothetical protein
MVLKAQADAKAKAFKAEQDVNAKRLAAAAKVEADAIAALLLKKLLKSLKQLQLKKPCCRRKQRRNSSINL